MTSIGVVAASEHLAAARSSTADHVEPMIVGGLLVERAGRWQLDPAFAGARYPSFALLFPGTLALSDPAASLAPVHVYLDQALPVIASVAEPGARIVFGSGTARRIPADADRLAAEDRFAEILADTRDRAAAHDLRIVLEPLHRGETNLLTTVDEAVGFLDRYGIDGVDVVADLFHVMSEAEPFEHLVRHVHRIGHVHLADGDRRYVGGGGYPWREFLDVLLGAGYAGAVSLECRWGPDFADELETSLGLVRGLREHAASAG